MPKRERREDFRFLATHDFLLFLPNKKSDSNSFREKFRRKKKKQYKAR